MARKTVEEIEYQFTTDTSGLDAGVSKVARALGRTDKAADKASKALGRTGNSLEAAKFAAQGAGGRIGELAGRAENFGRAFAKLGPVGGPVALAAAGVAAVGLAAVGTVAAMAKLVRAGGQAVDALKPLEGTSLGFSAEQVQRIEKANAALDGVGLAMQRLAGEIAANIAPSVEQLAVVMVAVGLAASDAFERFAAGESIVTRALDGIGRAFSVLVKAQTGFLRGWYLIRRAMGDRGMQELEGQIQAFDRLAEALDGGLSTALVDVAGNMLDLERAQSFIDGMAESVAAQAAASEAASKASDVYEKSLQSLHASMTSFLSDTKGRTDAITAAHFKRLDAIDEVESRALEASDNETERLRAQELAAEAYAASEQRRIRDLAELDRQMAKERAERASSVAGLIGQSATNLTGILVANAKKQEDAEGGKSKAARAAALIAFRVQQASALAQAYINTSLAITAALTIPPPAGQVLAVVNGVAGATQAAAIAAAPPPAFASGGIMTASSAPLFPQNGPGERLASITPGEGIFTRDQMQAMGGGMGAQTIVVDLKMSNRTVSRSTIRERSKKRGVRRSSDPVTA